MSLLTHDKTTPLTSKPVVSGLRRQIRNVLFAVIVGLVISGVTAFPLETEIEWLDGQLQSAPGLADLKHWIHTVHAGLQETNQKYPFIAYGSDWLAFAHLVIAIVFVGPLRDPVRNIWVIEFGIIASILIFPLAFIAGPLRGIPIFWSLIDCAFGVICGTLLWWVRGKIKNLEALTTGQ
jgi:hypothetical protein